MREAPEVRTADEGSLLLSVSTKMILTMVWESMLPSEKIGCAWRFIRSKVLDCLRGDGQPTAAAL